MTSQRRAWVWLLFGLVSAFGLLLACAAAGGVLGGIAGPAMARRFGGSLTVALALILMLTEPLAIALSSSVLVVAAGLFFTGFAAVAYNIVTVSYRQRVIPDALLGRVNSLYRFFGWGAMPLGAIAAGIVVALLEPSLGREDALRAPYLGGAIILGLLTVLGAATLRSIRAPERSFSSCSDPARPWHVDQNRKVRRRLSMNR